MLNLMKLYKARKKAKASARPGYKNRVPQSRKQLNRPVMVTEGFRNVDLIQPGDLRTLRVLAVMVVKGAPWLVDILVNSPEIL